MLQNDLKFTFGSRACVFHISLSRFEGKKKGSLLTYNEWVGIWEPELPDGRAQKGR